MTAAVVAEDVRRSYGDTTALDGVSLTVDEGDVFALIGPNGAGKTTLVRALLGTTDAEGTVEVFGKSPREVERARLGSLPQSFDPPARLTARELLDYYGGLYDDARPVDDVLADVGLAEDADTWYENLSGGQQRRVCVGTALVNDPDLLVLDEPTTGIDPAGRRALWRLIEDLAAGGTTVFLTTHYMAEAERLADEVGLLADGRLVARDSPAALIAEHGGESRLVIDTDAEPAITGDLGYPAELAEGRLTVYDVPPEEIGEVVAALDSAGATCDSIEWTEPDLEDVYLDLTGQAVTASGETVSRGETPLADGGKVTGGDRS
ncbi:ABC transporter ATP-binding protein [Halorientalis sp. IM1011]|uniref:ABC transporter ATP-binding protein n=1 Tax=Halorientalis sp. IM1011 TaxID=1932360 RepID=UPI00097CC38E|nr:ABC transporter ATP-binding protein [Halorientalis sp. IM1011]AQL41366.1 ABC transporter ATP-binding protein [Halorientalis sp. IM1011]